MYFPTNAFVMYLYTFIFRYLDLFNLISMLKYVFVFREKQIYSMYLIISVLYNVSHKETIS